MFYTVKVLLMRFQLFSVHAQFMNVLSLHVRAESVDGSEEQI